MMMMTTVVMTNDIYFYETRFCETIKAICVNVLFPEGFKVRIKKNRVKGLQNFHKKVINTGYYQALITKLFIQHTRKKDSHTRNQTACFLIRLTT